MIEHSFAYTTAGGGSFKPEHVQAVEFSYIDNDYATVFGSFETQSNFNYQPQDWIDTVEVWIDNGKGTHHIAKLHGLDIISRVGESNVYRFFAEYIEWLR